MAQKLIRYIEIEEFKKVLAKEKDRRFKLAYVLGFGSGLRISEIIGPSKNSNQEIKPLTQEQVNLEKHQIRILGKGGKERVTCTSPWLNENNIKLLPLKIPRRTLQDRFTKLCQKVLKKRLNFHTLRHGFANYMANVKNVPLPLLQQLGGWSRLDTVGVYTKANPVKAIEAAWESF
jgi:integrase